MEIIYNLINKMSFFYFDVRGKFFIQNFITLFLVPDDEFVPKKHLQEELDALKIPLDRRDACKDNYAEFKKCIMV